MDTALFPTKGNLVLARNRLAMSKQGYELLDKKRNILVREMMTLIDEAKELQSHIEETFTAAYSALQFADISLGISTVSEIAQSIPLEDSIDIKTRSVMGVEIPTIAEINIDNVQPQYGFARTNVSLDEAYLHFLKVKKLTVQLAEVENAIYRIAINIKRTQKRANALKNIMIPRYEKLAKSISESLEEKEREEFTRLKVIKSRNK